MTVFLQPYTLQCMQIEDFQHVHYSHMDPLTLPRFKRYRGKDWPLVGEVHVSGERATIVANPEIDHAEEMATSALPPFQTLQYMGTPCTFHADCQVVPVYMKPGTPYLKGLC